MATLPQTSAHDCEWRERAEKLEGELGHLKEQLAQLQRHVFGRRSEKLPRIADVLGAEAKPTPDETLTKLRVRKAARKELPTVEVRHAVPPELRHCPKCGSEDLRPLGDGKLE